MKCFFSLVMLVLMFSCMPGCGGGDTASSPEDQQKKLEETDANMAKGMDAMKGMNPGKGK